MKVVMLDLILNIDYYWWLITIGIAIAYWHGKHERLLGALTVSYLFLLLVLTVFSRSGPVTDPYGRIHLIPFWSYLQAYREGNAYIFKQILVNYLLFVPFGVLLSLQKVRLWKTLLCAFLFSLAIEALQLLLMLGLFEIDDVLGNTIGCLLGTGISYCAKAGTAKQHG